MNYTPQTSDFDEFFRKNALIPDTELTNALIEFTKYGSLQCYAAIGYTKYYIDLMKSLKPKINIIEMIPKQYGIPHKNELINHGTSCIIDTKMLPLRNESIQGIFASHIIEYTDDISELFSEMSRVIISGGNLLITQVSFSHSLFIQDPIVHFSKNRLLTAINTQKYGFNEIKSYKTRFLTRCSEFMTLNLVLFEKTISMAIPSGIAYPPLDA